ncbi:MAG: hypothetical protein ACO370_01170, partial [Ilumatobacteraceae bacterium]
QCVLPDVGEIQPDEIFLVAISSVFGHLSPSLHCKKLLTSRLPENTAEWFATPSPGEWRERYRRSREPQPENEIRQVVFSQTCKGERNGESSAK